jgi:hypothetical protein
MSKPTNHELDDAVAERFREIARLQAEIEALRHAKQILESRQSVGSKAKGHQEARVHVARREQSVADAVRRIVEVAVHPISFDEILAKYREYVATGEARKTKDRSIRNTIYNVARTSGWIRARKDGVVTWAVHRPEKGASNP